MRVLIFGKGDLSGAIKNKLRKYEVLEIAHSTVDVRDAENVESAVIKHRPDWIINCAGISDKLAIEPMTVFDTNLFGTLNIIRAGIRNETPVITIGSVAGLYGRGDGAWYAASKAGAISLVQSFANLGEKVYCVSPCRINTKMREYDHPGEDVRTRLHPDDVVNVIEQIMNGYYAPGANVIIRKVGFDRIDVFEDLPSWKSSPSMI